MLLMPFRSTVFSRKKPYVTFCFAFPLISLNIFTWNPFFADCSCFVSFSVMMSFEVAPKNCNSASVNHHVLINQDYSKVEHVKAWVLSPSIAKIPTVSVITCSFCIITLSFGSPLGRRFERSLPGLNQLR